MLTDKFNQGNALAMGNTRPHEARGPFSLRMRKTRMQSWIYKLICNLEVTLNLYSDLRSDKPTILAVLMAFFRRLA